LLYITVSVEQYCGITLVDALPENEGILEIVGRPRIPILISICCV
jgi:hypothetical protein